MARQNRPGMLAYPSLAVRNLWRNPRRTLITLTTTAFGIAALTLLGALNDGWLAQMKTNFILSFTGHVQIHARGFEATQNLQYRLEDPEAVLRYMQNYPEIVGWTQRIRTSGLASLGGSSVGIQIMATDPEQETWVTSMHENIKQGGWLNPGMPKDLLLGINVAKTIGAEIGDRVILMAQQVDGGMVSELFYLRGTLQTGAPQIDRVLAVIPLETAQEWLGMRDAVTDIVVRARTHAQTQSLYHLFIQQLSRADYEVLRWEELDPMVSQWLDFSDAYGLVVILVVVILVLLEILNTMLIALHNRQKELAVMVAIGTRKKQIFLQMLLEAVLLILLGSALGYLCGALLVQHLSAGGVDLSHFAHAFEFFYMEPVILPRLTFDAALQILGTTLIAALLAGIYPAWKATRIPLSQALRMQ
jgi:ABC-type lipoprotein release transport system permease subunit